MFLFAAMIGIAHAQFQIPNSAADVAISISPSSPRPNQEVTISLHSSAIDLNNATISWYLSGKLLKQGIGQKTTTVTTSSTGGAALVEAVMRTKEGVTVRKQISIKPAEVDLIWEANTYTPPLYRGKALFTPQASVHIVAIPHLTNQSGQKIDPATLTYTWKQDSRILGTESGRGKSSLSVRGTMLLKPLVVSVEVTSPDSTLSAADSIELDALNPTVSVYTDNPLYGILYNRALRDTFRLEGNESRLIAVPFNFSGKSRNASNLSYNWSVNGEDASYDPADPSTITLRHEGEGSGNSIVSVSVGNTREIMQKTSGRFEVFFGGMTKTPSF